MRILLVHGDARLARTLAKALRAHAYAVDVVADSNAAFMHVGVHDYDLVVLDAVLPGRDGFAVCHALRALGFSSPVLMLAAQNAVNDRIRALEVGADDCLPKPWDFRELLARIRALLRRGQLTRAPELRVGRLVVDPATREARVEGRAIRLTAREYAVLEYLMRRPGEVVTRAALLEHVWDKRFDGSTNVADVYIGYLRRKLRVPLITTVRGVGFRLDVA